MVRKVNCSFNRLFIRGSKSGRSPVSFFNCLAIEISASPPNQARKRVTSQRNLLVPEMKTKELNTTNWLLTVYTPNRTTSFRSNFLEVIIFPHSANTSTWSNFRLLNLPAKLARLAPEATMPCNKRAPINTKYLIFERSIRASSHNTKMWPQLAHPLLFYSSQ